MSNKYWPYNSWFDYHMGKIFAGAWFVIIVAVIATVIHFEKQKCLKVWSDVGYPSRHSIIGGCQVLMPWEPGPAVWLPGDVGSKLLVEQYDQ